MMKRLAALSRTSLLLASLFGLGSIWPSIVMATDVAILKSADVDYYDQAVQGIRSSFPARITVKEYPLGGNLAHGRKIGASLRASPPDLVVAVGLKAALASKLEIIDTPVVFCLVLDPEQHGLPAPNMTGIQMRLGSEDQLASLRSVLPKAARIGLLYDEDKSGEFVRDAHYAATRLGLDLQGVPVRSHESVAPTLKSLAGKIDTLWVIQDQTVVTQSTIPLLLQWSLDSKTPIFTFSSTLVQQGALGALVVDAWAVGQQAGRVAGAILRRDMMPGGPMLKPEQSQLALNLHSAEQLGLTPTADVIRLAGHLYHGAGPVVGKFQSFDLIP
jgi:putative ABC transport system substrate-binding protein